ncbi:MAG: serine/threonine-protein kinase, partial [Acidobacteriota bacterium]
ADLDHPHIARIFDGGATQGTLPFFVMEYVEGEPFDVACAKLTLEERLELFQKVCGAVHHAHRSLIVHRDLKPGNILVTADGEPKLLDFGIAKPLDRERESSKEHGRTDPGPMTIAFASPEQLAGGPITIGTDIYSLGVLLYRVLSGQHPHHTPNISTRELIRAIGYEVPNPPSRVAETEEAHRRLAGDLDAIALKTLSKRPEDRYDSAAQLAEEIQLHLDDLPIRAWRGTWFGRLRKSARRNKLAVAASVFLLTFSLSVTVLWRHAIQQKTEAEQARAQAERTRGFIVDFFKAVEPDRSPGPGVDLKKILDSGRSTLEKALQDEPQIRADLLGTLATIYHALALWDDAMHLQEQAVEHRRAQRPRDTRKLAVDLNNLAITLHARREHGRAEALLRESLPLWNELGDPFELNVLASLGATLIGQDKVQEAIEIYEQALERSRSSAPTGHPKIASIYYGLGAAHKRLENHAEAEQYLVGALDAYQRDPDAKVSRIAQVHSALGEVLHTLQRFTEARAHLEQALDSRQRLFGDRHLGTAASQRKLALLLIDEGELEAAESLLKQAGDTYSALHNEGGAAEVRRARDRVSEISSRRGSEAEPGTMAAVFGPS